MTTMPNCVRCKEEIDPIFADDFGRCPICGLEYGDLAIISNALLEALENIENDDGHIPEHIWAMRCDAIALATGQQEGDNGND